MIDPTWLVVISWLAFLLVWAVSAINVKKDVSQKYGWWWSGRGYFIRSIIAVVVIVIVVLNRFHPASGVRIVFLNSPFGDVGAFLCIVGVAFAIWARWHLGKNWSSRPSLKEGHELVTSGPYRFVRHPIYTGVLLAILGSAFVAGWPWLIAFAVLCYVFVRRVYKEEAIMTRQFPDQYPEYEKRTKALLPFIW